MELAKLIFAKSTGSILNFQNCQILGTPEEIQQLTFRFANGKLQQVIYRMLRPFGEID